MGNTLTGKIKKCVIFCLLLFLLTSCTAVETAVQEDTAAVQDDITAARDGTAAVQEAPSVPDEAAVSHNSIQPETASRPGPVQSDSATPAISEMQVHFIDVGQGDSTLIVCGNDSLLIDAGDNSKGTAVQLYLQKQGIQSLTYLVGTHPDSDHIGGLDVVMTKFDCDTVILPDVASDTETYRDVIDTMEYRGYQNTLPQVGDTYPLGDAVFTIIAPNGEYSDTNNASVGIRLVHGNNVILFTGDAEADAEADILQNGMDIRADVLHTGHHGSSTSGSPDFIDSVSPSWAVISCGADNPYGHPHEQTLDAFRERDIKVFRTDEQGSIVAVSDGESISWNVEPSLTWAPGSEPEADSLRDIPEAENSTAPSSTEDRPSGNVPLPLPSGTAASGTAGQSTTDSDAITYVLNQHTMKFHDPDCSSVETIKESNRVDTAMSRDEILAAGYIPCKRCNP